MKNFKLMWKDNNKLRAENWDHKTHTLNEASKIMAKVRKRGDEKRFGGKIKIVRVSTSPKNSFSALINRLPK